MAIRAVLLPCLLLSSACAINRPGLPPPPEEPTILIDDPKTCCDHPCVKPKVTVAGSAAGCNDLQPNNSSKPNPPRGSA